MAAVREMMTFWSVAELVLSAGSPGRNEDRAGVCGNVAWVVDGATQVDAGAFLPSASEGTWIAELVEAELTRLCFPAYFGDVAELLRGIAVRVKSELESLGYPAARTPPVASVGLLRIHDQVAELAIVGDVSIVMRSDGATERFFDARFLKNEQRAQLQRSSEGGNKSEAEVRAGIMERRRRYIAGDGGPVVLSANPDAIRQCIKASRRIESESATLLASDGFMRLHDVYGEVASVEELMNDAEGVGVGSLMKRLRARDDDMARRSEAAQTLKSVDDAVAMLVRATT